jgi:ribonuclease P protein component
MLKKSFRLKTKDIKNFFSKKYKKIFTDTLIVYFQENNLNHPRFAVSPKKEIFKKAVKRNKIKRKIYNILREILKTKKIKNYDFFIIIQKEENFSNLKELLIKIFNNV